MPTTLQTLGIDRLSLDERITLVQEIWDSIAADAEQRPLTTAQRQELERRADDDDANPDDVTPWAQVKGEASPVVPMMLPVFLRRAARAEYDAGGDWYERQQRGLGAAFTAAIQDVLDRIAEQPQLYQVVFRDIRRAFVKGFPYCIYYRERRSSIVVLSVFQTSRDPAIWQSRS